MGKRSEKLFSFLIFLYLKHKVLRSVKLIKTNGKSLVKISACGAQMTKGQLTT